jgi:hypothetical protein
MINYTERIGQLMADIVARVPTLSFLDCHACLSSRALDEVTPKALTPPATASRCRRANLGITTGATDAQAR